MKVRFNGGIKDVPLSEVTADNYIVPQREERFWHVLQEKVEFNRNTGKRISQPVLQKYDTKAYPRTEKYLKDAGYTITVLHDPFAWEKANAEAAAKVKAQEEADKAEAAKKAKEAEREALKEELRKELLAELKAEKKDKNNAK
jgi:hypothetical protein